MENEKFRNFIITNLKECALTEQERQSLAGNEGEILDKAISKLRIDERRRDRRNFSPRYYERIL